MADSDQQVHPMPQSYNPQSKYDQESTATNEAKDLRRQKQKKWALYIIAFVIFQTGIIVLFTFTVMKFRTPKFRMRPSSSFDTFDIQPTTPSFNMRLNAQLGVRNTNFGPFKYGNTTITFYYKGTEVGSATVRKLKVNFRSNKKVNVPVDLVMPATLASNSNLASDLRSGILPLTSQSKLSGKVEIMFIFKKKRTANMNCTMEVNISTKELQNIKCK
ncbi:Late embryogenesis abundant protein [Actinidia chinensis var. chinensis]|uniref:Late embryogenesis abundant protein n=1 Tax=Actinidia chinensis var. chinensis TaxID=1590841 RepID=A0A2R6RQQ1_ACTCC|nr:Late embryogenesis abundant protein [Actinidia chinensis var. chinensis]